MNKIFFKMFELFSGQQKQRCTLSMMYSKYDKKKNFDEEKNALTQRIRQATKCMKSTNNITSAKIKCI